MLIPSVLAADVTAGTRLCEPSSASKTTATFLYPFWWAYSSSA
jgi:hypothetical protein